MNKETLHERIEAYLADRLSAEDRVSFEQELAKNQELAQELAIHRDLAAMLADEEKLAFRKTLAAIAETTKDQVKPVFYLRNWALAGAVAASFALLLWWQLGLQTAPETDDQLGSSTAPIDSADHQMIVEEVLPPDTMVISENPIAQEEPSPQTPAAPKTPVKPKYSPFAPNPALDAVMAAAGDAYYTIQDAQLEITASTTPSLLFNATLLTAMEQPELVLIIRNNELPRGIEKMQLAITPQLIPVAKEDKPMAFAAKQKYQLGAGTPLNLSPGLYYLQLQLKDGGKVLWMDTLRVE